MEGMPDIASFARGNFTFVRLLMQYGRGVNQRKYLKDLLSPGVTGVVNDHHLDFGCNPLSVRPSWIRRSLETKLTRLAREDLPRRDREGGDSHRCHVVSTPRCQLPRGTE